jgi:hypothetical protein
MWLVEAPGWIYNISLQAPGEASSVLVGLYPGGPMPQRPRDANPSIRSPPPASVKRLDGLYAWL